MKETKRVANIATLGCPEGDGFDSPSLRSGSLTIPGMKQRRVTKTVTLLRARRGTVRLGLASLDLAHGFAKNAPLDFGAIWETQKTQNHP